MCFTWWRCVSVTKNSIPEMGRAMNDVDNYFCERSLEHNTALMGLQNSLSTMFLWSYYAHPFYSSSVSVSLHGPGLKLFPAGHYIYHKCQHVWLFCKVFYVHIVCVKWKKPSSNCCTSVYIFRVHILQSFFCTDWTWMVSENET